MRKEEVIQYIKNTYWNGEDSVYGKNYHETETSLCDVNGLQRQIDSFEGKKKIFFMIKESDTVFRIQTLAVED